MHAIKIMSDSSCDLPNSFVNEFDVTIIPFSITFDGKTYRKEGLEISMSEVYKLMKSADASPKTSLPSVQQYLDAFRQAVLQGQSVLCFSLTSKFSGSHQSAQTAKEMIWEEYPNAKVVVIDSCLATTMQGTLVMAAVHMKNEGMPFDEIVKKCEALRLLSKAYFTVDTLKFLQLGGRIGKASAIAGTLLNVKPIMAMEDGELFPISKVRGRKKTMTELVELTCNDLKDRINDYDVMVIHADCLDDALELKSMLCDRGFDLHLPIYELGVTITAHIGPTTLCVAYMKKYQLIECIV